MTTDDQPDHPAASFDAGAVPAGDPGCLRSRAAEIAATCAGFNLRRASRAVSQHFDHALAPAGLRMTQFTLLAALALGGSVTISQLARTLVVDRTTLTRNLRLLQNAGWIAAEAGGGRERRFALTPAGRSALALALPLWSAAQASVVEAFDPARWPTLVADLDRVVDGVTGEHTHPTIPAPTSPDEPASRTNGHAPS